MDMSDDFWRELSSDLQRDFEAEIRRFFPVINDDMVALIMKIIQESRNTKYDKTAKFKCLMSRLFVEAIQFVAINVAQMEGDWEFFLRELISEHTEFIIKYVKTQGIDKLDGSNL